MTTPNPATTATTTLAAITLLFAQTPAAADQPNMPKYAPDRNVDVLHVTIDVTPDFKARTVAGKTTIRFVPIARPLTELRLHAIDLTISAVHSDARIAGHQVTDEHVIITFADPIDPGVETAVTITHEAEPTDGLYFRTPEMGYRPEDIHLWTQGETHRARHWYPSFDYPNERFTTEMICRVPKDMIVLSNGKLVSEADDPATGLKVVRWLQDKPHVNYLVALVAGKFKALQSRYRNIPLAFYTPTSQFDRAQNSFRDTPDMMEFFEREIGVPYPWNKYDQVVVDDFIAGGMENTTLTVLTDRTLFTDASENIRSSQNLVSHELVHQWFGNYVTCKDWSHLWLNEGFATYYAHLYDEHKNGRDSMFYGLYHDARRILDANDAVIPIVYRRYKKPWEQFSYRAYKKGSWVLHMLRTRLGPDLYRRCIKTYLERYAFQSTVTEDLVAVFEEVAGRSLDQFFDQWIYHAHFPKLKVAYEWSESEKLAKVSVEQTQNVNDKVLLFRFRTRIRFKTPSAVVEREILVDEKHHDFFFPLAQAPTVVRFDPDYGLLAEIKFDKPTDMLYAQLTDNDDMIGRIRAVRDLKDKQDKKTVEKLKQALRNDPFYGVRIEAAKALREIHTPEALDALLDSLDQPDARARQRVVEDVGGFFSEQSLAATKNILKSERNPEILAATIKNLGRYHDPGIREILLPFLNSNSYRNRLADAAVHAVRSLDDPAYIAPLTQTLRQRENEFTSWGFGQALDALAYIARNEDDKNDVRTFLIKHVNAKKRTVQIAALLALGTLRDTKAIPVVETFTGHRDDDPIQRAATDALKTLHQAKEIPVELGDLRNELLELKKAGEKTKKDLDEVKKKLEAKDAKPAGKTDDGPNANKKTDS